jgi:glycosyltransferase involved in cell wall biosynthesis
MDRRQGPHVPNLVAWLDEAVDEFDVVVFFTYLYYPTARGLPVVAGRVPVVLHPLGHDEPPFFLDFFDSIFALPNAFAASVEEDAALFERRFRSSRPVEVVGIGTELDRAGDPSGSGVEGPYVVCVGRVDSHKGSHDLYAYFSEYLKRRGSGLKLVFVGESHAELQPTDDILFTGQLGEEQRNNVVAGALASIHPSYFESFSMTLIEAWAQRVPTVVNGRCAPLAGQVERSKGGFAYANYAEFEAVLDLLREDAEVGKRLAENGRRYVEERYDWNTVMTRYEEFLERVSTERPVSSPGTA